MILRDDSWTWGGIQAFCPKCGNLNTYNTVVENLDQRCFPGHCKQCRWPHVIVLDPVRCMACNPSRTSKITCLNEHGRVMVYKVSRNAKDLK